MGYIYDGKTVANILLYSVEEREPENLDFSPKANPGTYEYRYAVLPHAGSWRDIDSHRRALESNIPCVVMVAENHHGNLPSALSFLNSTDKDPLISAFFLQDNHIYARLYEYKGEKAETTLKSELGRIFCSKVSLHLKNAKEAFSRLRFSPWQIQSLRIEFPENPYLADLTRVSQKIGRVLHS